MFRMYKRKLSDYIGKGGQLNYFNIQDVVK